MGRLLPAGSVVRDQLDFYSPPGSFIRVAGVSVNALTSKAFLNGSVLPWPLVDGAGLPDSSLSAGSVYFNEVPGAPGYYAVRIFPDRVGYWRIVVYHSASMSEQIREYDVIPAGALSPVQQGGLTATFSK